MKITKDELYDLYVIQKTSTRKLASMLGVSQPTAIKYLDEYNIPRRSYKENKPPTPKGGKLKLEHKNKIAKALEGNINWQDPETGKHFNDLRVETRCSWCDESVIVHKWQYETYDNNYCSRKCEGEWKRKYKSGKNSAKYSQIELKCTWCSKSLTRQKSLVENSETGRFFCNYRCSGEYKAEFLVGDKVYNYVGGYQGYYGENWRKQRRLARKRDGYTCQRCGITKNETGRNPDVHHIKPFRIFGLKRDEEANDLSNLISYCNKCHKIVESELELNL